MQLKYGPYSPSRLETATCGYAFYHQYVEPRPEVKGSSLARDRGSAVHEVFEKITERFRDAVARRERGEEAEAIFDPAEVRQWVSEAVRRNPGAYSETDQILEMARKYIEKPPRTLTSDAGIELKLGIKMDENGNFVECGYDDPDTFARGRADIMMISDDTTKALVYDHKTQPNIEDADTFQMGFYAWVISKIHPYLDEVRTILHFAQYGHYSHEIIWTWKDPANIAPDSDEVSLKLIEDDILTRIDIVEKRESWEAFPHKNCQYCPFIAECPALAEYVERKEDGSYTVKPGSLEVLNDTNQAVRLAGSVHILEEFVSRAKKNLKAFVDDYGPVAVPGVTFKYKEQEKINWDRVNKKLKDNVIEIFKKHKVDPQKFMGFSETFSKGIWATENNKLVKALSEYLPRKIERRFSSYKS